MGASHWCLSCVNFIYCFSESIFHPDIIIAIIENKAKQCKFYIPKLELWFSCLDRYYSHFEITVVTWSEQSMGNISSLWSFWLQGWCVFRRCTALIPRHSLVLPATSVNLSVLLRYFTEFQLHWTLNVYGNTTVVSIYIFYMVSFLYSH